MEPLRPPSCLKLAAPLLALALLASSESVFAASHSHNSYAGPTDFDAPPSPPPATTSRIHVVQPGETVKLIAAWYGTNVWALVETNGLANPDLIHPGQQLLIPGGEPEAPAPEPAAQDLEPLPPAVAVTDVLEPTVDNIKAYIIAVFAPLGRAAQEWALRVAECESDYNPRAVNQRGNWHGLFQYHAANWAEFSAADIYDWQEQVRVTARLYAAGQQWRWRCR